MEKEPRHGLSFKMRIFKYFHFLVFYKFSLFSNAIINERNILVNHNHLKETCNELNPNAKPYYITQNALRLEKDSTKNALYSKICDLCLLTFVEHQSNSLGHLHSSLNVNISSD